MRVTSGGLLDNRVTYQCCNRMCLVLALYYGFSNIAIFSALVDLQFMIYYFVDVTRGTTGTIMLIERSLKFLGKKIKL